MARNNQEANNDITDLTEALRQLDLAQERVNQVIRRIRRNERVEVPPHCNEQRNSQEQDYRPLPNTNLRVGDQVRILNPNRGQQSHGALVGATTRGTFVNILTTNGNILRRASKSIEESAAQQNTSNDTANGPTNNNTRGRNVRGT